jgi:hypothetical protein
MMSIGWGRTRCRISGWRGWRTFEPDAGTPSGGFRHLSGSLTNVHRTHPGQSRTKSGCVRIVRLFKEWRINGAHGLKICDRTVSKSETEEP